MGVGEINTNKKWKDIHLQKKQNCMLDVLASRRDEARSPPYLPSAQSVSAPPHQTSESSSSASAESTLSLSSASGQHTNSTPLNLSIPQGSNMPQSCKLVLFSLQVYKKVRRKQQALEQLRFLLRKSNYSKTQDQHISFLSGFAVVSLAQATLVPLIFNFGTYLIEIGCYGASLLAQQHIICLQCRRHGFNPWVRKILWRKERLPTSVFLPGESYLQRSLVEYSPQGRK